jgi:hypothetical protein
MTVVLQEEQSDEAISKQLIPLHEIAALRNDKPDSSHKVATIQAAC